MIKRGWGGVTASRMVRETHYKEVTIELSPR
jgi:hypothetical protein